MGSLLFWWAVSALEHEEYIPQASPNQKDARNSLEAATPFYLSNFYFQLLYINDNDMECEYSYDASELISHPKFDENVEPLVVELR